MLCKEEEGYVIHGAAMQMLTTKTKQKEITYKRNKTNMFELWCVISAGYNNVEVAEFLLENGADVNVQDKGGLIPLHNASSYGVS